MPIRRRDDGEIVEEPTAPVPGRGPGETSDAPTDRLESRGARADSLFEPKDGGQGRAGRLEEPTVPMGADKGGDERTRIVAPRRGTMGSRATDDAEVPDPMRDPPVGWLVVVRGPGKGSVLTLGTGMNVIGRGPDPSPGGCRSSRTRPAPPRSTHRAWPSRAGLSASAGAAGRVRTR